MLKNKTNLKAPLGVWGILFFLFFCLPTFAQTLAEAEQLFNDGQFAEAAAMYQVLVQRNPRNEQLNYRLARSAFAMGDMALARTHFERSGTRFPLTPHYLGKVYMYLYEFELSAAAFRRFLGSLRADDARIPDINRRIRQAELAARLLTRVEDIAVIDSIVVDKSTFLSYFRFSTELGTLRQERIEIDSIRTEDRITYTTQRGDRRFFSDLVGKHMNIFTSVRLMDEWSEPAPLPEIINRAGANQNYPFLMIDGVTMFFASDGEGSIGGYDIFITRYIPATNTFLAPENVGFPFNSPFNDFMLVIDEINNIGWFASDRFQPPGKLILYFFVQNEPRVFFHSDNQAEVRERAKLRTFRQAEKPEYFSRLIPAEEPKTADEHIHFVITGGIIYTHINDFQSGEARRGFEQLQELSTQLENMQAQLNVLRQEFANITDASARELTTQRILALEQSIREQIRRVQEQTMLVRNEEIKVIQRR